MTKTTLTIKSNAKAFTENVHKNLSAVVNKARLDVEGNAKQLVPVDTGYLKNSIESRMTGDTEAEVTVGAEYAIHVEYGTVKMAARPYFNPAIEYVRGPFLEAVRRVLLDT